MTPIKGMTVQINVKTQTGTDAFGSPVYTEAAEDVQNVLVSPVSTSDAIDELNLTGRRIAYELCIPKGDTHVWENTTVSFYGEHWRTVGMPIEYIDELVPLGWNKKVKVERNE